MGYPMHYESTREIWDEVRALCPQFAGATYEKMAGTGWAQWPIFADAADDPENRGTPELYAGGAFATPDGKGHLVAAHWRPPTEKPDDAYPLVLCTVREVGHYSCRSMTGNCKALAALADEPGYVTISPADAETVSYTHLDVYKRQSPLRTALTSSSASSRVCLLSKVTLLLP